VSRYQFLPRIELSVYVRAADGGYRWGVPAVRFDVTARVLGMEPGVRWPILNSQYHNAFESLIDDLDTYLKVVQDHTGDDHRLELNWVAWLRATDLGPPNHRVRAYYPHVPVVHETDLAWPKTLVGAQAALGDAMNPHFANEKYRGLVRRLAQDPGDLTALAVLSDWYREAGLTMDAELLRRPGLLECAFDGSLFFVADPAVEPAGTVVRVPPVVHLAVRDWMKLNCCRCDPQGEDNTKRAVRYSTWRLKAKSKKGDRRVRRGWLCRRCRTKLGVAP
jgi:hypothetical protein